MEREFHKEKEWEIKGIFYRKSMEKE